MPVSTKEQADRNNYHRCGGKFGERVSENHSPNIGLVG
jgi:hypothetical protein